jgi:hypothetical protein
MSNPKSHKQAMSAKLLLPGILLVVVLTVPAKSQDCSQVLSMGIFDVSSTSREENLAESYLKWLTNREFSSNEEARSASGALGISLPKLPFGFNARGGSESSNSSTWGKELAEYLNQNREARSKFYQDFMVANTSIVNAWRDCVLNRKGLLCWGEQTDNPNEILLNMEVRPLTQPFTKLLKIRSVTNSPHVRPDSDYTGEEIAGIFSIIYTRVGRQRNDSANFVVRTDDPNYGCRCSVAAIPSFTPPPPASRVTSLTGRWEGAFVYVAEASVHEPGSVGTVEAGWTITESSDGALRVQFRHTNPKGEIDTGILNGVRTGRQLVLKNAGIEIELSIDGNSMKGYIHRLENGVRKYVLETVDLRKISN